VAYPNGVHFQRVQLNDTSSRVDAPPYLEVRIDHSETACDEWPGKPLGTLVAIRKVSAAGQYGRS
jgi:hypothetical protein